MVLATLFVLCTSLSMSLVIWNSLKCVFLIKATLRLGAKRRASAFKQAFNAQLAKLSVQPASYGKLGLGELFEMREECLREFGFIDVYRQAPTLLNTIRPSVWG